jgi:hypothetical protein
MTQGPVALPKKKRKKKKYFVFSKIPINPKNKNKKENKIYIINSKRYH